MFKLFLSPLSLAWKKTLNSPKLPVNLRSALLILFAMAIVQMTFFGAAVAALVLLTKVIR